MNLCDYINNKITTTGINLTVSFSYIAFSKNVFASETTYSGALYLGNYSNTSYDPGSDFYTLKAPYISNLPKNANISHGPIQIHPTLHLFVKL